MAIRKSASIGDLMIVEDTTVRSLRIRDYASHATVASDLVQHGAIVAAGRRHVKRMVGAVEPVHRPVAASCATTASISARSYSGSRVPLNRHRSRDARQVRIAKLFRCPPDAAGMRAAAIRRT
jgi:hypothetical protein